MLPSGCSNCARDRFCSRSSSRVRSEIPIELSDHCQEKQLASVRLSPFKLYLPFHLHFLRHGLVNLVELLWPQTPLWSFTKTILNFRLLWKDLTTLTFFVTVKSIKFWWFVLLQLLDWNTHNVFVLISGLQKSTRSFLSCQETGPVRSSASLTYPGDLNSRGIRPIGVKSGSLSCSGKGLDFDREEQKETLATSTSPMTKN